MARKERKRMIDGHLYDPTSREYWNKILAEQGLSTESGRDPRLVSIGNSVDLETLERTRSQSGRKMPHKQAE